MSLTLAVHVLTALAALIVLATWWRLGSAGAGVGQPLVWSYAAAGVAATVGWTIFLVLPETTPLGGSLFGVFALGLWWLTGVLTVFIMIRLLAVRRAGGRHAAAAGRTPGTLARSLGTGADLVLIASVCLFTFAYVTKLV